MDWSNEKGAIIVLVASCPIYGLVRFALSFTGLELADQVALAALAALAVVAGTIINVIRDTTALILKASTQTRPLPNSN
jgi:hypothetical protein